MGSVPKDFAIVFDSFLFSQETGIFWPIALNPLYDIDPPISRVCFVITVKDKEKRHISIYWPEEKRNFWHDGKGDPVFCVSDLQMTLDVV